MTKKTKTNEVEDCLYGVVGGKKKNGVTKGKEE